MPNLKRPNVCTFWPDRWGSYDISAACQLHDEDYANQVGFLHSNWKLFERIKRDGHPVLASAMLAGTTLAGWIFYLIAGVKHGRLDN